MEIKTLLKANLKRHKGSVISVFFLILLVSASLVTVLTVWNNSSRYVKEEMDRLGFGTVTAWVSGLAKAESFVNEIAGLDAVNSIGVQEIIFSEYKISQQESDSEGQLITYDPYRYPYKIFTDDLSGYQTGSVQITSGEIYISPSLSSMFGAGVGDTFIFPIARSGVEKRFVVKGYFEDPFMGSSMIGMKSFLICKQDHDEIVGMITESGIDGLARDGYMLHIFQTTDSGLSTAQFNALLNESTSLQSFVEFTHSYAAISGFMLTLQNVFTGLLLAFVCILILAALAVLSHCIGSTIDQDYTNMGILKTMGFTSSRLRILQLLQYLIGIGCGLVAGALLALPAAATVYKMTVTTTGLLIPSRLPAGLCLLSFAVILLLLLCFIWLKTGKINKVSPIKAIQGNFENAFSRKKIMAPIRQSGLNFWMALRQLLSGKKWYIGSCLVAMLLVFFASLIGRVNAWLGPNGEGLMNAFNPADLHIAAQPMGKTGIANVEQTISEYTNIVDQYRLAMPSVSINGVDYTANVITEPKRFHLLEGRTCKNPDEVVLTEFVAADLGVSIGDTVKVAGSLGNGEYTVSGIYQCANDMGANIGINQGGTV